MAPEVIIKQSKPELSSAADVFSLGRLIYFIAMGQQPLKGYSAHDVTKAAKHGDTLPLNWQIDSSIFVKSCRKISEQCLSYDVEQRPNIKIIHNEFSMLHSPDKISEEKGENMPRSDESVEYKSWQEGLQSVRKAIVQLQPCKLPSPSMRQVNKPQFPTTRPTHKASNKELQHNIFLELVFPQLEPTALKTQILMVLECLTHWNVKIDKDCCCNLHARIMSLQSVCDILSKFDCDTSVWGDWAQCPHCFALQTLNSDDSKFVCRVCA